ncbi:MAG: uroporphyrinogen decarboxylase family protein [Bacteroidales bacterium]|nr:uroporphyrinogen decarboxylase family protein [Bacteroidales bacterium]
MNDWVSYIINSERRSVIPLMTQPGIELTGKRVIDAINSGIVHYQAIKTIYDNYPTGASTMIMDLSVEAEAFGSEVNFFENEVPVVTGRLVFNNETIEKLKIPPPTKGRLQRFITATHLAAINLPDRPVFAGCIGPFSLAGRLFGMTEIMTSICTEPDIIKQLLRKCTDFLLEYITAFKDAGSEGILMAEPAAGLLDSDMCNTFSSAYVREIVEKVQDENFLFILHNCGNTGHVTQSMLDTGARAIHLGNKINITEALKEIPSDILVLGNLDPVGVFKSSTPEEVESVSIELMELTEDYKNFILSSGCDIPSGVPLENIDAFFRALKYQFIAA